MRASEVGTVYGVVLNDTASVERMAAAFHDAPYRAPPIAPILYIKPRNTFASNNAIVAIPTDPGVVRIDATIGAIIGRRATKISVDDAASFVSGFAIVADLTLPHKSIYRPAIRQRCRDGFCPIGDATPRADFDPDGAVVAIDVNRIEVHRRTMTGLVRPLARLLADVTNFMTLDAGDVLLLGVPADAPLARPGDSVSIRVGGLATLTCSIVAEPAT